LAADIRETFPDSLSKFGNLIVYGASGIGKYSQVLKLIQKYSPSGLKYDKHMIMQNEKQTYLYRISDIHYEIDMALLGCNSKIIWHEIFSQIVDIISMKSDKNGIIVCKNFHSIHTELLDIFYSYMQQYNHPQLNIHIKYILITEHLSFLSNRILDNCRILSMKRPSKPLYQEYMTLLQNVSSEGLGYNSPNAAITKSEPIQANHRMPPPPPPAAAPTTKGGSNKRQPMIENKVVYSKQDTLTDLFSKKISNISLVKKSKSIMPSFLDNIDPGDVLNLKEIRTLREAGAVEEGLPKEIFNNVCDAIIHDLTNPRELVITSFRDTLYDILIYNLDAVECFWYIFTHFIMLRKIEGADISVVLDKTYTFLKYYNNNYRPIYHLENIFLLLLTKLTP
jgi:hypothetical protein